MEKQTLTNKQGDTVTIEENGKHVHLSITEEDADGNVTDSFFLIENVDQLKIINSYLKEAEKHLYENGIV